MTEFDLRTWLHEQIDRICDEGGDIESDFDLDGTIRAVDVAGIYGQSLGAEWGEAEVGGVKYRIAIVSIPLIVDSAAASLAAA